jgi:hypothetical protein
VSVRKKKKGPPKRRSSPVVVRPGVELLRAVEGAELLGVDVRTLLRWGEAKRLTVRKLCDRYYVTRRSVLALLHDGSSASALDV